MLNPNSNGKAFSIPPSSLWGREGEIESSCASGEEVGALYQNRIVAHYQRTSVRRDYHLWRERAAQPSSSDLKTVLDSGMEGRKEWREDRRRIAFNFSGGERGKKWRRSRKKWKEKFLLPSFHSPRLTHIKRWKWARGGFCRFACRRLTPFPLKEYCRVFILCLGGILNSLRAFWPNKIFHSEAVCPLKLGWVNSRKYGIQSQFRIN